MIEIGTLLGVGLQKQAQKVFFILTYLLFTYRYNFSRHYQNFVFVGQVRILRCESPINPDLELKGRKTVNKIVHFAKDVIFNDDPI